MAEQQRAKRDQARAQSPGARPANEPGGARGGGEWRFGAPGAARKDLAATRWDAAPAPKGKFGSPEWYAQGDALSSQLDTVLNTLLDEEVAA